MDYKILNRYHGQLYLTGDHVVTVYYLGAADTVSEYEIEFFIE